MIKKSILILLITISLSGCERKLPLHTKLCPLMGTIVKVVSPHPQAAAIAFDEIKRIENIFSSYIETAAIYRLNQAGFLEAEPELVLVIEKAREFYKLSDGLFDVTIGPLAKIWKKAIEAGRLPAQKEIEDALSLVGFGNVFLGPSTSLRVNPEYSRRIEFRVKNMKIDLGAIAKGYAVDAAVKELKRRGINSALIDAGGDIYCLGEKFGKPWAVGLQHPRKLREILTALELKDCAIATSGDYEQFMEVDFKRYSHIINPKTGYPIESDAVSVTVIADDVMTADAVATCVFLLGKEEGMKRFRHYPGIRKIIIVTKNDIRQE